MAHKSAPREGTPEGSDGGRDTNKLIDQVAAEQAGEVGRLRAWMYGILGLGGLGIATWNAPDIVKDPVLKAVGLRAADHKEFGGKTAKERIDERRPDAKALVDRIIAAQPKVELSTVTDEQVRGQITRILADKTVSPEELWMMLSAWQQRDLVAIARRYKALEGPEAANPAALAKRLPNVAAAGQHLAGQLQQAKTRGDAMSFKWQGWTETLNANDDTPAHAGKVKAVCTQLRAELVEEARVPFSSDLVVAIGNGGGYPINAKGAGRLVAFEKELLGQFVVERHALIDQAETYGRTLQGAKRLNGLQTKFRDTMKGNGMKSETVDARVTANAARQKRIDAAAADLARVVTVIELRNAGIADPAWQTEADKAIEAYFGTGKVPARPDVLPALRNARIRGMDALRAELNNDHPDWVDAEKILRAVAYTLPVEAPKDGTRRPEEALRGDPAAADRDMQDFLRRTETSGDPRTQEVRAIIAGLAAKRPITVQDARDAYALMKTKQEMPFSTGLVDTLAEWAGQHESAFYDPREPFKRRDERDRFAKSRQDLIESIVVTMAELENLRSVRLRAQSGFSATQNGVETGNDPDTQIVLDPQVAGVMVKDLREQAEQGAKDVKLFLGELRNEHALKPDDVKRDAAASGVKVARKIINVLDRIRGMRGQEAPDTARMVEVVRAFDTAPLKRLEESYDALLAYLEDPQNTPERAVADRKGSTPAGVRGEREKMGGKALTRAEVQGLLRQNLTPDQRVALRLILEDQRDEAVRPFLNEEAANLLALAALADEGAGKLGDIQRSRDSWLQTILFVLGVIAAYQGAKGRIALGFERWGAKRHNKRVLRAYEAKRVLGGTPPPEDEKGERAEHREVLAKVNLAKPKTVRGRLRQLSTQAEPLDFNNTTSANAEPFNAFAGAVRAVAADLRTARETYTGLAIEPEVTDRVRLHVAMDQLLEPLMVRIRVATDGDSNGPARRALGRVYQALSELQSALLALQPDLPGTTPRLATADIDACDTAQVLILACAAGMDIENTEEPKLREQLKREKAKLETA